MEKLTICCKTLYDNDMINKQNELDTYKKNNFQPVIYFDTLEEFEKRKQKLFTELENEIKNSDDVNINQINHEIIKDHINQIYNNSLVQKTSYKMIDKGYVEIVFDENNEDRINSAKKYTIESIKKIQDNGYDACDIGIIVRDNKDAKIKTGRGLKDFIIV